MLRHVKLSGLLGTEGILRFSSKYVPCGLRLVDPFKSWVGLICNKVTCACSSLLFILGRVLKCILSSASLQNLLVI